MICYFGILQQKFNKNPGKSGAVKFFNFHYNGKKLNIDDYDIVYLRPLNELMQFIATKYNVDALLEHIYDKFNENTPQDFTGHNLSVSDIIVLVYEDKKIEFYYVDDISFVEVTQSFFSNTENNNSIDDILECLKKIAVRYIYGCDKCGELFIDSPITGCYSMP